MSPSALDPTLKFQLSKENQEKKVVIEEIEGIIKVYKDGYIERPRIVPDVSCALDPGVGVTSGDVIIDKSTNTWARAYIPTTLNKLPLLIYFHGGGFCVGSANWSCYHEFLGKLSAEANCVIMSVNYRLAPENPLPAAYDDGLKALMWVKKQCLNGVSDEWWSSKCNFSTIFLAGDSAGANIAHNVAIRVGKCPWIGSMSECESLTLGPLTLNGTILIQPFFGGELRTQSEKFMVQPPRSALKLTASDTYWRLALPGGANRDHPWCNPLGKEASKFGNLRVLPTLVFIADMDILKDRNLELRAALNKAGKDVGYVVCNGVGHAFQILNKSQVSQKRTTEMISHIKTFISR